MFYLIETKSQFDELKKVIDNKDIFVKIIAGNDDYHPNLQSDNWSLIYIRPISSHKGYILGLDHNELVFNLRWDEVLDYILNHVGRVFVQDKKEFLYYTLPDDHHNIYDVTFIDLKPLKGLDNNCVDYYYRRFPNDADINKIIPISKHYEKCENLFNKLQKTINQLDTKSKFESLVYAFNNVDLTEVFFEVERQGLELNKEPYIEHFGENRNHRLNISKGRIYTHYNLYTTTGRPSNSFNNINFAALSKTNGERATLKATSNELIEMDINGYHPRIIGNLVNYKFPENDSVYEHLEKVLEIPNVKELTFQQLYGGIKKEYKDKPFFKEVDKYIWDMWDTFQQRGHLTSPLRSFVYSTELNPQKTFNYLVQSYETYNNVIILKEIINYLKNKKTKLILYTYDAFLFDYNEEDGEIISDLKSIIKYPVKVKRGNNYNTLNNF